MAAKKTDLAKKEQAGALAVPDYGQYAGRGFENTNQDDYSMPFLTILQALSPQVQKADGGYIEGAEPGMLLLTSSGSIYAGDEGVEFVPVTTQHVFIEWVPRKAGGGFVAIHECDSDVVRAAKAASTQFGKYKNGENDLVETFYIYGLLVEGDEVVSQCLISFTSTKIKPYKTIMTKIRTVKGRIPLFANRLRIKTVSQKNTEGTFYNFDIVPANGDIVSSLIPPDSPLLEAASAMHELVSSGAAKVDHGGQRDTDGSGEGAGPSPF